jgi:F420-non-reducing hydrogenase iron-sulfur subunit
MNYVATQTPGSQSQSHQSTAYEPRIIAFLCKWCSSAGSDLAGVSRMQYPPNIVPNKGADGVLVSGCHPGDCHYIKGNMFARRRIQLLKQLIDFIGVDDRRFKMSWISAAEGAKFTQIIKDFTQELIPLGPQNQLRRNP